MRHKYIILGLLGFLLILILFKIIEPTHYPVSVKYEYGKEYRVEKVAYKFLKDREKASDNSIKWSSFQIGDTKEQVNATSDYVRSDTIILGDIVIPCATSYYYNSDNRLIEVHYSITEYGIKIWPITNRLLELYGPHYIRIYRSNNNDKYFWLDGNNLVTYSVQKEINDAFLSIMDISVLSQEQLVRFIRNGGSIGYNCRKGYVMGFIESEKNKVNIQYSSPRTYKYGDSDIYQGSSQQKSDLEAIDKYFGF